jgi:hypothetical protein
MSKNYECAKLAVGYWRDDKRVASIDTLHYGVNYQDCNVVDLFMTVAELSSMFIAINMAAAFIEKVKNET